MPISENELKEALSRASSLMTKEGQRKIDNVARMNSGNFDDEGGFTQPIESHNMRKLTESNNITKVNPNSGLPKAIRESIMNNPINDSVSDMSFSDVPNFDTTDFIPKRTPQKQVVQENVVHETYTAPQYYSQHQYIPQPQMMIDYNYIRAIVNECVQANLKQIKEEILKESSLKAIRIGGENKIQLIDTKNNLYESKLEYKKNISKK